MIKSLGKINEPSEILSGLRNSDTPDCLYFEFDHSQYYADNSNTLLGVILFRDKNNLRAAFTPDTMALRREVKNSKQDFALVDFQKLVSRLNLADIHLRSPMKLDRVYIKKPWGQEIWYSGIEDRGICSVQSVLLPWILDLLSTEFTGVGNKAPILLKILDPLAEKSYGDLYFEQHIQKREVYIVTNVDENAWPNSVGKIRYGFNQQKIDELGGVSNFKRAYLKAVRSYQKLRSEIDSHLHQQRQSAEMDDEEVASPEIRTTWEANIAPGLQKREELLKQAMYDFTGLIDIRLGDVIHVHPFTPHSLLHGIRVIEFQTPHYERQILSFTQKVITQGHWDTEEALELTDFDSAHDPILRTIDAAAEDVTIIADFDEFTVTKVILDAGGETTLSGKTYSLVIGVQGTAQIADSTLEAEDGYYVSLLAQPLSIINKGLKRAIVLIARPRQLGNKA